MGKSTHEHDPLPLEAAVFAESAIIFPIELLLVL